LTPVVLEYLRRYPQMSVDLVTEGRKIDIVVSGFDAGIRLAEDVPRDMVSVPLQMPLRFAIVGAPSCFAESGVPQARRAHVVPLHLRAPVERRAVPLGIRAQRQKGQR